MNIWAVAALSDTELVAVGGSDDASGGLVVAKSGDAGRTWSISHPDGPALTTIGAAGGRLVGATDCSAQYAGSGPSAGLVSPTSCLYESTDGGLTWVDLHQGLIVDPSFVDSSHGFAHSPLDTAAGNQSRLLVTQDGGRTWNEAPSPCGPGTPWIAQAIATSPTTADVLCVAGGAALASWEIVGFETGAQPTVLARPGAGGLPQDQVAFRFAMGPSGVGLLFGDSVYRTLDHGATWALSASPEARVQGGCFLSATTGYFVIRDSGRFTGIVTTSDGGSSWRELARWPFFGS